MMPHDTPVDFRTLKLRELELFTELERRDCEKSYASFVKSAWHILEPDNELVWNWHLEYLCNEVQAQLERITAKKPRDYHLIVNVPPRSLKTYILTRMPAAWAWIHWPWMRFMRGSYSEELALEHAVETRDIIQSDWYQSNWGDRFKIKNDQNNKSLFKTNKNGHCVTTSTGSKATGRGADIISLDDPISAEQAESETERNKCIRWYKRTIKSRLNNKQVGAIWIIMQRLHENDLTGHIIAHEGKNYKHICLPSEDCEWVNPPELRAQYVDGLLFKEKFSKDFCENERLSDSYSYAGQYMQRPSPEEGGAFKRQFWKFWVPAGMQLPPVTGRVGMETYTCQNVPLPEFFSDSVCSWDMTFKDSKTSDFVSGHVVAQSGADFFFLDELRGKFDFAKSSAAVVALRNKYPMTSATLIEDKANGPAIIAELSKMIPGLIPISTPESKYARAMPMSRKQQAGNIVLPHPSIAPWVNAFIDEYAAFPNGAYDDRVDSGDQAINYLSSAQRVWPHYRPKLRAVKIDWRDLSKHTSLILSQYVDGSLRSSILMGLWNARSAKLVLFDELEINTSVPELIYPTLQAKITRDTSGVITDLNKFEWYGNELMFAKTSTSSRSTLMKDGIKAAYSRANINVRDNPNYDEFGAIQFVARMILYDSIIMDFKCQETSRQNNAWIIEGKEPAQGFGFARALCNMVSMLVESGKLTKVDSPLKPYSKEKEQFRKMMHEADTQGRLMDFIKSGVVPEKSTKGSDGWMV
jgi:predicted phage terminase large subunit-like protein